MADVKDTEKPECFGRLDLVFPMGERGLRHSPPGCLECALKTDCLRTALSGGQGDVVREERLERVYRAGAVGFLGRWAQQKELRRRRPNREGFVSRLGRLLHRRRNDGPEAQ